MLAGGDSIDDVDILRAGAAPELFDQIRASSTIGTWLRGFNWAAVRMLDAVSRVVLARAWQAGLGPKLGADLMIDLDATVCEVYGIKKQGAQYGYTKVRRYHPLLATLAGTGEVLHARMRGGNDGSARGAASLVRETISRVRDAGASGELTFRADSAFYSKTFIRACRDHDARFSVTVKQLKPIKKAIVAIPDEAWVPIDYWLEGGADVAETTYTAFKGTRDEITLRLIVRRVRPTPGSQLALDVVFDYHPILTDRQATCSRSKPTTASMPWSSWPSATSSPAGSPMCPRASSTPTPPGSRSLLAHILARWSLKAAGAAWQHVSTETLRTKLVAMPARLVHTARRVKLRVPTNWPWREAFDNALVRIAAIPAPP